MTILETRTILEKIKIHYQEFSFDDSKANEWHSELKNYDYADVYEKLLNHLRDEYWGEKQPKLYSLTRGLITTEEKSKRKEYAVNCSICGFKIPYEQYDKHFDRCSSVEYVVRETKKWFNKDLNKKELYEMPEDEFNIKYLKLLNHIYKNTTDKAEKTRIGFIFNPPSEERAKEFLKNGY